MASSCQRSIPGWARPHVRQLEQIRASGGQVDVEVKHHLKGRRRRHLIMTHRFDSTIENVWAFLRGITSANGGTRHIRILK